LVGFTAWESKGGDQDVGIQDDPHEALFASLMDEPIYIILCLDTKGLGADIGMALEFPPASFLEVKAQGLSN
jgi:hypothetical protein